MKAGEIWALTQREWCRTLVAWRDDLHAKQNRDSTTAWMFAKLSRAQKIPALKTLLVGDAATPKIQTIEEQRDMLRTLSAQYGTPLQKRKTRG